MKLLLTSILLSSLVLATSLGFQKAIGTSAFDYGKKILTTQDGYIVVGEKSSDDHQRKELLVYKTDKDGNVMWAKSYGGTETYVVNDAYLSNDNHIHLSSERYLSNRESLLYMELDENGNLQKSVPYDEGGNEIEPWAIAPTSLGGKIVVGFTKVADFVPGGFYNASLETKHLYILGMNANGDKLWSKKLNTPNVLASNAFDIVKTNDNHFLVIGNYLTQTEAVNILIKIDEVGNIIWQKTYPNSTFNFRYIDQAEGNNFIITGTAQTTANKDDILVLKISDNGNVLWSKQFGNTKQEKVKGAFVLPNGEIYLSGTSKSFGSSSEQIVILNLLANGNLQWTNKYGTGTLDEVSNPIIDNGFLVFTGFSLRTANGAETLLLKVPTTNQTNKSVNMNQTNLNFNFTDSNLPFEAINENAFSGNYQINQTVVSPQQLNVIDINI